MKRRLIYVFAIALLCLCTSCISRDRAMEQARSHYPVVTFIQNGTVIYSQAVEPGTVPSDIPETDGCWLSETGCITDPAVIPIEESTCYYAWVPPVLKEGHIRFIHTAGSRFSPDTPVTRGEAAVMLYALVDTDASVFGEGRSFSDVPDTSACYDAVTALSALDVMQGYSDSTFRPDDSITRAEFLACLCRLTGTACTGIQPAADVPDTYWAGSVLTAAAAKGWLVGYGDSLNCPENPLTRAEAAVFINRMRGREPDRETIDLACRNLPYADVPRSHWAFYDIVDASYSSDLMAYILGEVPDAQPGFLLIDDRLCHLNGDTLSLDYYTAGFHTIDGGLYYVKDDGFFLSRFEQGLTELDGDMFYVTAKDGPFLTDDSFGYLTFGSDGRYTSGSEIIDSYVDDILDGILDSTTMTQDEKLYAAYCAIRDGGYTYRPRAGWVRGSDAWTIEAAEIMYEYKSGACFYWTSAFLYLARRLGYQAYAVSGGVGTRNQLHAWVMIEWDDGEEYIFDVELEWAYARGFYDGKINPTNMFKQPLNATKVVYIFPGETYYYQGNSVEENDEEDLITAPEEDPSEPSPTPDGTEPPEETAGPDDPTNTDPAEPTPVEPTEPAEATPPPLDPTAPPSEPTDPPTEPEPPDDPTPVEPEE